MRGRAAPSTRSPRSGACRPTTCGCGSASTRSPHHAVLGVPHVRRRLDDAHRGATSPASGPTPAALEERLADLDLEPTRRAWPGAPAAVHRPRGPPRRPSLAPSRSSSPQLDALVAVIVGYVDHVMDRIGENLVELLRDGHRGAAPAPGRGLRRRPLRGAPVRPASSPRTSTTGATPSSTAWSSGPARRASTASGPASESCRRPPRSTPRASGWPASTSRRLTPLAVLCCGSAAADSRCTGNGWGLGALAGRSGAAGAATGSGGASRRAAGRADRRRRRQVAGGTGSGGRAGASGGGPSVAGGLGRAVPMSGRAAPVDRRRPDQVRPGRPVPAASGVAPLRPHAGAEPPTGGRPAWPPPGPR